MHPTVERDAHSVQCRADWPSGPVRPRFPPSVRRGIGISEFGRDDVSSVDNQPRPDTQRPKSGLTIFSRYKVVDNSRVRLQPERLNVGSMWPSGKTSTPQSSSPDYIVFRCKPDRGSPLSSSMSSAQSAPWKQQIEQSGQGSISNPVLLPTHFGVPCSPPPLPEQAGHCPSAADGAAVEGGDGEGARRHEATQAEPPPPPLHLRPRAHPTEPTRCR